MQKKNTHGGARKGSGAKPKGGEPTTTIAFRVPISKADEIKELVKSKLKKDEQHTKIKASAIHW